MWGSQSCLLLKSGGDKQINPRSNAVGPVKPAQLHEDSNREKGQCNSTSRNASTRSDAQLAQVKARNILQMNRDNPFNLKTAVWGVREKGSGRKGSLGIQRPGRGLTEDGCGLQGALL